MRSAVSLALRGITVSRVTCTRRRARRLSERGAQVESMEGFAVLRAAERAGIPRDRGSRHLKSLRRPRNAAAGALPPASPACERVLAALLGNVRR